MSESETGVTEQQFRDRIEGKEVKDIALSALGSHIDVVLNDGEPYTTITVRGDDLSWEIGNVRSLDTDT